MFAMAFDDPSLKVLQIIVETFKGEVRSKRFCQFSKDLQEERRGR